MAQPILQKPQAGATSSQQGPQSEIKFENDFLEAHNKYRAMHGSPPLTMNKDLSKLASEWAAKLIKENKFEHRPNNKYGENIYMKFSTDPNATLPAEEAVDSWYNEIKDFTFGKEPQGVFKSAHFTQIIWKGTREVGFAKAKGAKGKFLLVANYNPTGNIMGQFVTNVPPKRA